MVSVALLAIVAVPLALAGLSAPLPGGRADLAAGGGEDRRLGPPDPPLRGAARREVCAPGGQRIARLLSPVAIAVVLVVVALVLARSWRVIAGFGPSGWLALVLLAVVAVLTGHLLGGPDPEDRAVLAINNSHRFPGTAILIAAAAFPGLGVLPAILVYVLVASVVSALYVRLARPTALRESRRRPA